MKAVVIEAPGIVHLQEYPMPLVDPESVLIRVSFCGICGTDFAICSGETSFVRDGLIKI